jgi:predicted Zn-dependent protease
MKLAPILFTLIVGTLLLKACSVNPVTGKKQVVLMSEEQEIAMGKEADPQIIAEYGLYADSNLQRFLRQKGLEMAKISHRPNLNWQFRVVDSDVINAFAVPGGYVYFTRGILAHFNNEAQFAGVLGHEIGHVTARHSVAQQTKGMATQLGVMAAMVLSPDLAQFGNELSQGAQLLMLSYGRADETQSDELGVEYSSKIGYDAKEMAKFFLTLQAQSKASGNAELPEFMSTHPDPGNRNQRVSQLAIEYQQKNQLSNLKVGRNDYLKRIEGIVYGMDPKQGYLENGIFYHPELRFQFNAPAGWRYNNSPTAVTFSPAQGDGLFFLTVGKGNTPQEAAQAFQTQYKLQVKDSRQTTVNGLPAYLILGDQVQQAQQGGAQKVITVVAAFIQHNKLIYQMIGAGEPTAFQQHQALYQATYNSFRPLTDAAKINIKPERVALFTTKTSATLRQHLTTLGTPTARVQELAILNGLNPDDQVVAGSVIKYVKRF